ncbi:MAG: peptide chain release factor N(5)-glutamine methyltransferase [Treponema sp.]|nr:peptide chain release factor N(5)-glutamine methyltransferase [Treponema sp.]
MTIQEARTLGFRMLTGKEPLPEPVSFFVSATPFLDTDCFLEYILRKTKTFLMAHHETVLTESEALQFRACLEKRLTGLPVAYITGHKEFYGLDFLVTPAVLIPKPDTEILVEKAVAAAKKIIQSRSDRIPCRIADICTGSGCIAVSVLHELCSETENGRRNPVMMTVADISGAALNLAKKNARRLLPENISKTIEFKQGDLLSAVDAGSTEKKRFDLILSNPPYIPAHEVTKLLEDGRNEPRIALDGDTDMGACSRKPRSSDGLAVIRRLVPQAYDHLEPDGLFFMETAEYNAQQAACITKDAGFTGVHIEQDLSGQLRVTTGKK